MESFHLKTVGVVKLYISLSDVVDEMIKKMMQMIKGDIFDEK